MNISNLMSAFTQPILHDCHCRRAWHIWH